MFELTAKLLRRLSDALTESSIVSRMEETMRNVAQQLTAPQVQALPPGVSNPPVRIGTYIKGHFTAIAVQQKPQIRRTYWDIGRGCHAHCLAFPYVVFVGSFFKDTIDSRSFYVFYSNRPVVTTQTRLCFPNLPNIFEDGRVCLGEVQIPEQLRSSQSAQLQLLVEQFWSRRFIDHLLSNHFEPGKTLHPGLESLDQWVIMSRTQRSFILTVKWRKTVKLEAALRQAIS